MHAHQGTGFAIANCLTRHLKSEVNKHGWWWLELTMLAHTQGVWICSFLWLKTNNRRESTSIFSLNESWSCGQDILCEDEESGCISRFPCASTDTRLCRWWMGDWIRGPAWSRYLYVIKCKQARVESSDSDLLTHSCWMMKLKTIASVETSGSTHPVLDSSEASLWTLALLGKLKASLSRFTFWTKSTDTHLEES